jgi:hypothetical protein
MDNIYFPFCLFIVFEFKKLQSAARHSGSTSLIPPTPQAEVERMRFKVLGQMCKALSEKQTTAKGAGDEAQVAEHLHETLRPNPSTAKTRKLCTNKC